MEFEQQQEEELQWVEMLTEILYEEIGNE